MLQLLVHFTGSRYGLGDFFAQKFAVATAEAMHRDLDRPFGQPQLRGQFGVRERGLLTPDESFEGFKNRQPACARIALAQTVEHCFDQRDRPAFLVNLVQSQRLSWFGGVTAFRYFGVQGNDALPSCGLWPCLRT